MSTLATDHVEMLKVPLHVAINLFAREIEGKDIFPDHTQETTRIAKILVTVNHVFERSKIKDCDRVSMIFEIKGRRFVGLKSHVVELRARFNKLHNLAVREKDAVEEWLRSLVEESMLPRECSLPYTWFDALLSKTSVEERVPVAV